ncbi:hypothetical protein Z052_02100 [Halorubrum sp. C191]|nr:hypothetical protein Z052_02100 [Halorubrum sp. C191]
MLPYTSYEVREAEYLGRYDGETAALRASLRERGYSYRLLAATKRHPRRGEIDAGSFARIPDRHPDAAGGTGLDDLDPRECQYHVHLFDGGDGVEVYGHYEVHPLPHVPTWDLSRPYPRHYYPTWDDPGVPRGEWTYLRGVTDPRLEPLLTGES